MASNINTLNTLISIRQFAVNNLDNISFKMDAGQVKQLSQKITQMDRLILGEVLALDIEKVLFKKETNESSK